MQSDRPACPVAPRHIAGSLVQEATRKRPWHEWAQGVADTLGLIPGLNVPAELISGGLSLYEGDLIGFALSVAGLLPVGGEIAITIKMARRARRLAQGAKIGARVAHRARHLAQQSYDDL